MSARRSRRRVLGTGLGIGAAGLLAAVSSTGVATSSAAQSTVRRTAMPTAVTPGPLRLASAVAAAPPKTVGSRAVAACPAATYGGDPLNSPYQVPFSGSLSGTFQVTSTPAGPITLPSITGTFCGLLELPLETATVQPANLNINPVTATIARATVPTTVIATGPSVGTVDPVPASNGGLNLTLSVPAGAQTGLFGVSCVLPTQITLSTTAPGGSPLVDPLRTGAHATLTATGFTIADAISTGATGTCPSYLASQIDNLLALPNNHTSTSINLTLVLVLPPGS